MVRTFESKIVGLENERLLLSERLTKPAESPNVFDQRLRTAPGFLANPWDLWQTGRLEDRHTVLKLTCADTLRYKRGEGFRTANLALHFKV